MALDIAKLIVRMKIDTEQKEKEEERKKIYKKIYKATFYGHTSVIFYKNDDKIYYKPEHSFVENFDDKDYDGPLIEVNDKTLTPIRRNVCYNYYGGDVVWWLTATVVIENITEGTSYSAFSVSVKTLDEIFKSIIDFLKSIP
jgi:hypothetical protein